jgi:hypothetical protein
MATGIAIVASVVAVAATVESISQQKKAAKAQQEAAAEQTAISTKEARDKRQQAAREARIKRAQIVQQAENQGIAGGTTELGATSAVAAGQSREAGEQAFETTAAEGLAKTQQQIADASSKAATAAAVGNLSSSIFSAAGGFGAPSAGSPTPKGK